MIGLFREIYLKKARQIQKICRLANLVDMYETNLLAIKHEEELQKSRLEARKYELESRTAKFEQHDRVRIDGWEEMEPLLDRKDDEFEVDIKQEIDKPSISGKFSGEDGVRQSRFRAFMRIIASTARSN